MSVRFSFPRSANHWLAVACGLRLMLDAAPALAQGGNTTSSSGAAPAAATPAPSPGTSTSTASFPVNASASAAQRVEEAERLFKRGIERMDAGDFAAACPLLEQSQAADASSGTLLNLGDCYEHVGLSASADRAFERAVFFAKATGRDDRAEVAQLRRARLAPSLRRLKPIVAGQRGRSVTLMIDDQVVSQPDQPVAVDPGPHQVRASLPGYAEYSVQVVAPNAGDTVEVQIPELMPLANSSARAAEPGASSGRRSLETRQVAAIASGAVGLVGVISGTVFGLRSAAKHRESDDYCDGNICRDPRGVQAMDSARTAGNISTVSFIVGGLGLGAATVLWFVVPSSNADRPTAALGAGPGSLHLRGTF